MKVAFVVFIVYGVFQIFSFAWLWFGNITNSTVSEVTGGVPIFVFRGTTIIFPFVGGTRSQIVEGIIETVLTIVALSFGMGVFSILKEIGSPFQDEVVDSIKKLAVALLLLGFATGFAGFLASGIAWVLYMIFDYGCALQREKEVNS